MGGLWERQIRSVRSILSALMWEYDHSLDDESLGSLLAEVVKWSQRLGSFNTESTIDDEIKSCDDTPR